MASYKRLVLKLSGEVLSGKSGYGIDGETLKNLCTEIGEVLKLGCQVAIVVGGGNIIRGVTSEEKGIERQKADYMGILATYINAIGIEDSMEKMGIKARIYGALNFEKVAERWDLKRILKDLDEGRVVIFAGGTGNPYFSTDTAAILRASEVEAEVVLKATKVDGVFDRDPLLDKSAKFFPQISYMDVLKMHLKIIDLTALTLAMERQIPIVVFNIKVAGNLKKAVMGEPIGTIIS